MLGCMPIFFSVKCRLLLCTVQRPLRMDFQVPKGSRCPQPLTGSSSATATWTSGTSTSCSTRPTYPPTASGTACRATTFSSPSPASSCTPRTPQGMTLESFPWALCAPVCIVPIFVCSHLLAPFLFIDVEKFHDPQCFSIPLFPVIRNFSSQTPGGIQPASTFSNQAVDLPRGSSGNGRSLSKPGWTEKVRPEGRTLVAIRGRK